MRLRHTPGTLSSLTLSTRHIMAARWGLGVLRPSVSFQQRVSTDLLRLQTDELTHLHVGVGAVQPSRRLTSAHRALTGQQVHRLRRPGLFMTIPRLLLILCVCALLLCVCGAGMVLPWDMGGKAYHILPCHTIPWQQAGAHLAKHTDTSKASPEPRGPPPQSPHDLPNRHGCWPCSAQPCAHFPLGTRTRDILSYLSEQREVSTRLGRAAAAW